MTRIHCFPAPRKWPRFSCFIIRVILSLGILTAIPGTCVSDDNDLYDLSLEEIMNVKVNIATKTDIRIDDAPSIVSVITSKEIEQMGARNLVDVLRTVPGFDSVSAINVEAHIGVVRGVQAGVSNNKIKVLINGQAAGEGSYHGGLYSFLPLLPLDMVDRIEIIRGPGSALYGTNAFLGALNLITKTGGKAPSKLSAKAGSFSTRQYTGEYSNQWGDFNLYAYGGYFDTDGESNAIESDRAAKLFGPNNSAAPGNTTEAQSHQEVFINTHYKNFHLNGIIMKHKHEAPAGVAKMLADDFDLEKRWSFTTLGWKAPLGSGNLAVNAFYDYTDVPESMVELMPEEVGAVMGFPEGESPHGGPERKNSSTGVNVTLDYPVVSGIEFVGGAAYEHRKSWGLKNFSNYNMASIPLTIDGATYRPGQYIGGWVNLGDYGGNYGENGDMTISAVFGQGAFDLKELFSLEKGASSLLLTAGLRYDYYDAAGDSFTPRFGVSWSPDGKLFLKGLYGQAFRAPTFAEMFTKNNNVIQGNPDLAPETNTTYEAQVGYNFSNMKLSLTCFYIEAENLITTSATLPGGTSAELENTGSMETSGIEVEFKWLRDQDKYMYANMTWQNVKNTTNETIYSSGGLAFTQDDFFPGDTPETIFNVGVNYRFFRWMNANLWVNYTGKRDRTEEKVWNGETLERADDRDPVDARALVNLALTFNYKDMEVQVCGYNIFDVDHRDPDPDAALGDDFPASTASFTVKLSYEF